MYFIKAELHSSLQCNKATAIIKIHFLDTYYSLKLSQKRKDKHGTEPIHLSDIL